MKIIKTRRVPNGPTRTHGGGGGGAATESVAVSAKPTKKGDEGGEEGASCPVSSAEQQK